MKSLISFLAKLYFNILYTSKINLCAINQIIKFNIMEISLETYINLIV